MARVTSKDVGRLAGVHPSTVSRVLNRAFDQHSYDPQTVERIEQCARQLGYRPSHAARSLRMGKTMLIGVVVSDISNPFFGQIAAQIEQHARQQQYRTLICNTQDDAALQAEHLADLAARQVDGIILSPSGPAGCDRLISARLPVVTVDRPLGLPGVPHVGLNNTLAGRRLGEHLRQCGKTRVGVVMPRIPNDPTLAERLSGLLTGLGDQGQIIWTEIGSIPWLAEQGRQRLAKRLLASDRQVQAVVGLSNHATLAVVQAMGDIQLTIGRPVGVAGIDDFSAAAVLRPGVTVLAQPVGELARLATRTLIRQLTHPDQPIESTLLAPTLVARGSLGETVQRH